MQVRNDDIQDQSGGNGDGGEGTNTYVSEVEWMEMKVREMLTSMFLTMMIRWIVVFFMDEDIKEEGICGKLNMKCLWDTQVCMTCSVSMQLGT